MGKVTAHGKVASASQPQSARGHEGSHQKTNMHDGIALWYDCCVCEAEPYWADMAEEMGIDLSPYADDEL